MADHGTVSKAPPLRTFNSAAGLPVSCRSSRQFERSRAECDALHSVYRSR